MEERPLVGVVLGRYHFEAKLGAGGMGEVYAARDATLGRKVAIKVLPSATAGDPDRRARFEREARAIAALSHPHIVTVHGVEEHEGRLLLVMELVAGRTLDALTPPSGLAVARLLELAIPLADAVAAAHAQGIIHRDLKPQNVMVTDEGRLKVLDFGLARVEPTEAVSPAAATATAEGSILGTAAYMSPEQAQGKRADGRSDIFSLGVVLFELATGRRPFVGGDPVSLLASILRDTPPSLDEVQPALPRGLARIVRRCLAKDPGRRYQSAVDLRNDLEELSDELRTGPGRAAGASGVPTPGSRRGGWLLALLPAALFAAGLAGWKLRREPPAPAPSLVRGPRIDRLAQLTFDPGPERAPSLSPDGHNVVYASRAAGNWDIYQLRIGGENANNLTADAKEDDLEPAISPDGEKIAFRSERQGGGIFVMGATGESARRVSDFGHQPSWSPDGSELAVPSHAVNNPYDSGSGHADLWAIRVATSERRRLAPALALQPAWSPDGTRVAYWGRTAGDDARYGVFTVAAAGGQPVPLARGNEKYWTPSWSGDGRWLYYSTNRNGAMWLWRARMDGGGEGEPLLGGTSDWAFYPRPSRDGRRLVFAAGGQTSTVSKIRWDPAHETVAGAPQPLSRGANPDVHGDWIVYQSGGAHSVDQLYLMRTDGSGRRRLTDGQWREVRPRWSPDGKEIAFSSNRSGKVEVWLVRPDGSGLRQATIHADGHPWYLPTWRGDGSLFAYDLEAGSVIEIDPRRPGAPDATRVAPGLDGKRLLADSVSRDGQKVAFSSGSGGGFDGIFVQDKPGGDVRKVSPSGTTPLFLPDGRRLIYEDHGTLVLLDLASGRSRTVVSLPLGSADNCFSADGEWIYFAHLVETADLWMATLRPEE